MASLLSETEKAYLHAAVAGISSHSAPNSATSPTAAAFYGTTATPTTTTATGPAFTKYNALTIPTDDAAEREIKHQKEAARTRTAVSLMILTAALQFLCIAVCSAPMIYVESANEWCRDSANEWFWIVPVCLVPVVYIVMIFLYNRSPINFLLLLTEILLIGKKKK
jgi:hypothetical protein